MNQMRDRGRDLARRVVRKAGAVERGEIDELRRRVESLETQLQESRRLNLRVAELLDVVQELLVPVAARDEDRIRAVLDEYSASL